MKERIQQMLKSTDKEMVELGVIMALNNLTYSEIQTMIDWYWMPNNNNTGLEDRIYVKGEVGIATFSGILFTRTISEFNQYPALSKLPKTYL